MSFAVLWQHVFQVVMCVLSAVQRATAYTHHNLKHMLPQHCITYNDVSLLINSTKV
jgi:hypothetical protein